MYLNTNEAEQSFECLLLFVFILLNIVPILCSFFDLYANISLVIYMLRLLTLSLDTYVVIISPNNLSLFHFIFFSLLTPSV